MVEYNKIEITREEFDDIIKKASCGMEPIYLDYAQGFSVCLEVEAYDWGKIVLPVLYDKDGNALIVLDDRENLNGKYEFKYNGYTYIAEVMFV